MLRYVTLRYVELRYVMVWGAVVCSVFCVLSSVFNVIFAPSYLR